uniref:sugar transferase n=1 Tax=Gemmiger formicilis TaxID=745368 RepID=UPI004025A42B
ISLSLRFNIALGLVYAGCMLLAKATMLDSRYFAVTVPAVNAVLLPFSHAILKRLLIRFQRSWGMETLVGVVTTSDRAERLIPEIQKDWSRRVVGVSLLEATPAAISTKVCGVEVKATFDDFMDWIRREALDEVYVDVPMDSGESFIPYLDEMESMGLTVHFRLPLLDRIEEACCDETSAARLSRSLGRCAGGNIVTMGTVELQLRDQIAKRCMDVVGAVIGCIISIPIIAVVAIPLKLESPGPLFFKQKRVGRNGRYFYIHKLRSMYVDAEARKKELMAQNEMNGLMFKMEDDPRVTKVGKFIRRTSIDELPQFFDVLRGDMSLVGTRPPTVDEYKQYESHHKRRLSMKPGITGLWQVSGRSDIEDFEEVVKLDVAYIDNWSLWGDVKILFKTIYVVFAGKGAK